METPERSPSTRVTISDVDMPFGRMVVFIIKWTLASIPAIIIIWIGMMILMFLFAAVFGGAAMLHGFHPSLPLPAPTPTP